MTESENILAAEANLWQGIALLGLNGVSDESFSFLTSVYAQTEGVARQSSKEGANELKNVLYVAAEVIAAHCDRSTLH